MHQQFPCRQQVVLPVWKIKGTRKQQSRQRHVNPLSVNCIEFHFCLQLISETLLWQIFTEARSRREHICN
jgi:hypothetical protein